MQYSVVKSDIVHWNSQRNFDSRPLTCQTDNWGMPNQTDAKPYFPDHEAEIRIPCSEQWGKHRKPMSDLFPMSTVLWYKNSDDYDDLIALDLIPENKGLYPLGSSWGQSFRTDYASYKSKTFLASTCQTPSKEAVKAGTRPTWEVTRIGPIKTYGGYDWVQIGWDNLWDIEEKLKQHPEGIYILDQYMSPVYEVRISIQS